MKKTVYGCTALFLILLVSCVTPRSLNLNQLRFGMSRQEVYNMAGNPRRILAANRTEDGILEVLEFVTNRNESYALEFWNDSLVGFEFMHVGVEYVPPMRPPTMRPPATRPPTMWPQPDRPIIFPPATPTPRPPSQPLPPQPSRPSQPGGSREPTRQVQPARPSNQNDSIRPPTRSSGDASSAQDSTYHSGGGTAR